MSMPGHPITWATASDTAANRYQTAWCDGPAGPDGPHPRCTQCDQPDLSVQAGRSSD